MLVHLYFVLIVFINTKSVCGIVNGLLLKDNSIFDKKVSYIVRIIGPPEPKEYLSKETGLLSTGICVTDSWVLTAAHILKKYNTPELVQKLQICLSHFLTKDYKCGAPSLIRNVTHGIPNPRLSLSNESFHHHLERLVSLLRLGKGYSSKVMSPARLYKSHITDSMLKRKIFHTCTFLGWGATRLISMSEETYDNSRYVRYNNVGELQRCNLPTSEAERIFICVHDNKTAICAGDGGGPLVCNDYVVAINTMTILTSNEWCNIKQISILEEIFLYIEWIQQTITEHKDKFDKPNTSPMATFSYKMHFLSTCLLFLFL